MSEGASDEDSEDHTRKYYPPVIKNIEVDADDKDEARGESSGLNISFDEPEAGPGSDDPLSSTDSNVGSLISESSVIDRIIEDDARCSLFDALEDDSFTKDKTDESVESGAHAEVFIDDKTVPTAIPLSNHSKILQLQSLKENTETPYIHDNGLHLNTFSYSCQSKPLQKQVTTSSIKKVSSHEHSKEGSTLEEKSSDNCLELHDSTKDYGVLLSTRQIIAPPTPAPPGNCRSSIERGMLPPIRQIMSPPPPPPHGIAQSPRAKRVLPPVWQTVAPSTTPPPPFNLEKIHIPRPTLPPHLGICFFFMNRGFCKRSNCVYNHKVLSTLLSRIFFCDGTLTLLDVKYLSVQLVN